jgi:hypothetical protein
MDEKTLTVIIPSRKEVYLNQTINDVLKNSTGKTDVFVILDGYDESDNYQRIEDPRVHYLELPYSDVMSKRIGVNMAVSKTNAEYVMALDAHCMVGYGFDTILMRDCEDNMVMIPRRYKLDPVNWKIMDDSPVYDYQYWMWTPLHRDHIFKEYNWHERREARKDIMIDDTLTMQASSWIMKRSYYNKMGFMKCEGYTPWGQEDVEICLECWTNGGRVVTNKNTWYAHLFKGKTYGRMYKANQAQHAESRRFAYDYWVNKNRDKFREVINKFMPIPNFPENWEDYLHGDKK